MVFPKRIPLAHLPTPIQRLDRLSEELGVELLIKRDDFTGMEMSGNKVRKLEFSLGEALRQQADVVITCGGLQSNHARATAAATRKLGLRCHLVLRGDPALPYNGNLLLDHLFGAAITFLNEKTFNEKHETVMEELKEFYAQQGDHPYLIPMGASNPIGTFGYAAAYEEILEQEAGMSRLFDVIACAVGSGGTHAGLVLGNVLSGMQHRILGIPITDDGSVFDPVVRSLVHQCLNQVSPGSDVPREAVHFMSSCAGRGYALNTEEEMTFIREFAQLEGILLDPVYTGKAFRGLVEEIRKGSLKEAHRILFIHTGGLFGLFPKGDLF